MKFQFCLRILALAIMCCMTFCVPAAVAQSCPAGVPGTTCTQVFSAADVRTSLTTAGYTGNTGVTPDIFNTSTLNLTCATSPIIATLSGPQMNTAGTAPALNPTTGALQAGGPLLVDNSLFVGVNGATPTNVCTGYNQGGSFGGETVLPGEAENCFEIPYSGAVGYPTIPSPINGEDPDTGLAYGATQTVDYVGGLPVTTFPSGGVGSIDISGLLTNSSTPQSVTIQELDYGGVLSASSIFLATNCTPGPVTGPATVSGNTITPTTLNQNFNFNTIPGNNVGLVYDLSGVTNYISNPSEATPQTADLPVDPATYQTNYVEGTSFATSTCMIHSGEGLPYPAYPLVNGEPESACKLYTLECINGSNPAASGALCPASEANNEVIQDVFDGPQFSLQNIYTPYGMFREGMGLLMASEGWGDSAVPPTLPTDGGPCAFDPASQAADLPCPQNLLNNFSGPGGFGNNGITSQPNSTVISAYGVPEDFTTVFVAGEWPDNWVSNSAPTVYFYSQTPNFSHGAYVLTNGKLTALPNYTSYVPAPIKSITYGVTAANSVPLPANEPTMTGEQVLSATPSCPETLPTTLTEPNFAPPPVTLSSLPDGQYALYYYAQDCAGTQELQFTQAAGSWSTSFFTVPINIDTTKPTVSGLTLSPAGPYTVGQAVTASYTCADPPANGQTAGTSSGVVLCGTNLYAPQTTYSVNLTGKVPTGAAGKNLAFTVYAVDGAGNISIPATVTYTVNKK